MSLLRGKLFAGALFAGALFGASLAPQEVQVQRTGGGGWRKADGTPRKRIPIHPVVIADTGPLVDYSVSEIINNDPVIETPRVKKRTRRRREEELIFKV